MSVIQSFDISTFIAYLNAAQRRALLCFLCHWNSHFFCWEHVGSLNLVFSFFGIVHPLLDPDMVEALSSKEHGRPWALSSDHKDKKMKWKLRRERRICSEWLSQLVTKLGPELWSTQPPRKSLPRHLVSPTVCWALRYILGTWQWWLQRFFYYRRLLSKWIGQTQKAVVTMTLPT